MKDLWTMCGCLRRWGVGEELWIDGSFLTEEIDPKDVDLVLVLPERFEDTATDEQLGVWDWWDDGHEAGELLKCDTFILAKLPIADPEFAEFARQEAGWKKWFGTNRQGRAKGIGRILLPDGCI
jgi:uncharacterized protein DUF6932